MLETNRAHRGMVTAPHHRPPGGQRDALRTTAPRAQRNCAKLTG